MAELERQIPTKLTPEDIIFSHLQEARYAEYICRINEWYATLPENNIRRDLTNFPRISKQEFQEEIRDGIIIIIACLKGTDELVATIAVGQPKETRKGLLTSTINLYAVSTEYRRRGLGGIIFDEGVRTAKVIGAQKLELRVYYENKFQGEFMLSKGLQQH